MRERSSSQPEAKSKGLLNKAVIAASSAALLLAVTSCTPKEQSRWAGGNTKFDLGKIPADACLVNGTPLILNAATESDGDFNLVYVRNNGDIVVRHWAQGPILWWQLQEAGEFFWTGGKCPTSTIPIVPPTSK